MEAMSIFRLWVIVMLGLLLTSCADVAMTGAQALYNRHSLEKKLSDQYIAMRAYNALNVKDNRFHNAHLSIAVHNKEVLLAGQVPLAWQKKEAERILKNIPNVEKVYNLTTISTPSSTLKQISDTWLTAKIKAKLLASNEVDGTQIKVVTESGTVYLMGILPPSEAQVAVEIASQTDGVERVIKVFSYLRISKT